MSINLLLEQDSNKKKDIKSLLKKSVFGCVIALIIGGIIYTVVYTKLQSKKEEFIILKDTYDQHQNLQNEIEKLKSDISSFQGKINLQNDPLFKKFYWSEKLIIFSQMIPKEIWLKTIKIDESGNLKLHCFLLPPKSEKRPLSIIRDLIKKLQNNNKFYKDFKEISLVDLKSSSIKDKEILIFNLTLSIKN